MRKGIITPFRGIHKPAFSPLVSSPSFNPITDLPGLAVWYHGENSATTKQSDIYVTQWNDISGNNRHATTASGTSVVFEDGAKLNGKNCLFSNGGRFAGVLESGWTPVGNDVYIIAAVKRGILEDEDTGSTVRPVAGFTDGASVGSHYSNTVAANKAIRAWDGGAVTASGAADSFGVGKFAIIVYQLISGSSMKVWVDGTLVIDVATARDVALGEFWIGGTGTGVRRCAGYYGEIMSGEGILSDAQVAAVSAYLEPWRPPLQVTVPWRWTSITEVLTDVGAGQGVAVGDDAIFVTATGTNKIIRVYNATTSALASSFDSDTIPSAAHSQVNGMHYDATNNKLYVGANNYQTTPALGWVYEFDYDATARTLAYVATRIVRGAWCEGPALLSTGDFLVCYHDTKALDLYNSSWVLQGSLDTPNELVNANFWQGLANNNNVILANVHNTSPYQRAQAFYYNNGSLGDAFYKIAPPRIDCQQGVFYDGTNYWWAERTLSNNLTNNHVVRTDALTSLMDVG